MDLGALVRRLVAGPSGAGGAAAPGGAGTSSGSSASSATTAGASPRDPLSRPAWRDAAPIQRMVGSAPLVAPNAAFSARLATARPAPLALAPLGHDRGLEAPAGLVSGIAAPVQRSPSSPMPASVRTSRGARSGAAASVQRSSAGITWPTDLMGSDETSAEAPSVGAPSAEAAASGASMAPDATPAVVARSAGAGRAISSASPLTTAPSPVTGLVGLIGPAAVASGGGASSGAAGQPSGSAGPVVARSLGDEGGGLHTTSSAASTDAVAIAGAPSTPVTDRPVRRIRVGAPLTPTVSRMAIPGTPTASSSSPAVSSSASPSVNSPSSVPTGAATTGAMAAHRRGGAASGEESTALGSIAPSAPASGRLPTPVDEGAITVSRSAAEPSETTTPELAASAASAAPIPSPVVVARLQRAAAPAAARSPLVGGLRPVLSAASSAISVSRRAAAPESEAEGDASAAGSSADALAALGRTDWAAGGAGWAPSLPDAVSAAGGAVVPPGSPFAIEPGQGGIAPARLTWTNPLADPTPAGGPSDVAATPASEQGPAWPGAHGQGDSTSNGAFSGGASASSSPTVSRSVGSRPGTVSRSVVSGPAAPRGGLRVGPAMGGGLPGTVARPARQPSAASSSPARTVAGLPSQGWDGDPVVARAVTIDEVETTTDPTAASGEAGAAAGGTAPAASGGGGGGVPSAAGAGGAAGSEAARDQETQAWADRLYDRISMRLRRDLLVERERSGALVDRGF